MKRLLLIATVAGFLVACNDTASVRSEKDSLDSIANLKKDVIDSSADAKKDAIDSTTEVKKDALDSAGTMMTDTTKKNN